MFFEKDQGLCHVEGDVLYCTCFLMYCFGCLHPCNIPIPLKQGGAPPGPEDAIGAPPNAEEEEVMEGAVAIMPQMERDV